MNKVIAPELDNVGYIPIRISPIRLENSLDVIRTIKIALPQVVIMGGVPVAATDCIDIVAAVTPYPIHKVDFSLACDRLYAALRRIIPKDAQCYPICEHAEREVAFYSMVEGEMRNDVGMDAEIGLNWLG